MKITEGSIKLNINQVGARPTGILERRDIVARDHQVFTGKVLSLSFVGSRGGHSPQ